MRSGSSPPTGPMSRCLAMPSLCMVTQECTLPQDPLMALKLMPIGRLVYHELSVRNKIFQIIYLTFKIPLNNKEFAYSVDVSNVDCHCNAAAYFIDMPGWYFIYKI